MSRGGKGYEHLLKILVIGDSGSCKTELLQRYLGEENEEIAPTLGEKVSFFFLSLKSIHLGLDYKLKDITFKGKDIKLQLW